MGAFSYSVIGNRGGGGKFIVAFVPACGEKEYYFGKIACSSYLPPPGAYFSLYGLTRQASFLGGLADIIEKNALLMDQCGEGQAALRLLEEKMVLAREERKENDHEKCSLDYGQN
ncbi:hypothetical protein IFM89_001060 [Coptis chinensis]|uniref:Uncharacterized protein n=1 Tax=Coptis chinensis TaxID=261450 RepID=A0A835HEW6_9MAGN|nr:hypothetical protein IFM89_001060 [Coptis chinensis]